MEARLEQESAKLARSWMKHEATALRDYLVAGVEDPRLNLQSLLTRHFLIRALTGERFEGLMEQECRFAAAMNWLCGLAGQAGAHEDFESVLHALHRQADNAEGIEIPHFLPRLFRTLPRPMPPWIESIPNYIERFLRCSRLEDRRIKLDESSLNTFQILWHSALAGVCQDRNLHPEERLPDPPAIAAPFPTGSLPRRQLLTVLEPACGSANDYRFLHAYGIARLVEYRGFDLCAKNVRNSLELFPETRFELGNVFEIDARDRSYDLCVAQDLFEHLSPEGLQTAVREICRVTKRGLCLGFFNMDEIPAHRNQPVEDYYWNTLSMDRMKELFVLHGFRSQVIHIGTFLRQQVGCDQTHNANAYTFLLFRDHV